MGPRPDDAQCGVAEDEPPSIFVGRHSQDMANGQAANGFVEYHQDVSLRMPGRYRIQKGHNALLGFQAALASRGGELCRFGIPSAKSLAVIRHDIRQGPTFPLAVIELDKPLIKNGLQTYRLGDQACGFGGALEWA